MIYIYTGQWTDGQRHVNGTLSVGLSRNGYKYKGEWGKDRMNGKGTLISNMVMVS